MAKRLVQNEQEAVKMMEAGTGLTDMVRFYREKYDIETSVSMWNDFRRRRGIARRFVWDTEVIPWKLAGDHAYKYEAIRLRQYARRKAGKLIAEKVPGELDAWLRGMDDAGTVVHYDPDTMEGFTYVPRRKGVDLGIIREPERITRRRATR